MIWAVLQAGLWMSRLLAESELSRRAHIPTQWPRCAVCGQKLQSKGFRERQMKTILGTVVWKRRVGRCHKGCQGSQRIPLDEALGLCAYQATDEGLIRLGCLLSVMMPYGLASWLLGQGSGVSLGASSLWNAVQHYGAHALATLELELETFEGGESPLPELLPAQVAQLCLTSVRDKD